MTTLRRYRREKNMQRSNSPAKTVDVENDYNWKINRYQRANWGDKEAKEAHASVVKYMWRKEHDLSRKINSLKNQISRQVKVNGSEKSESESSSFEDSQRKSKNNPPTKREIDAPLRGIHFRTNEDKTFEKLNLIKSRRKLEDNEYFIEKARAKANADIEDDLSDELKIIIRGKSAYQISAALLAESGRIAREAERRELEKYGHKPGRRGIYEIMADRNELGITHDNGERHDSVNERKVHSEHDYRWNKSDYLNLVGYRMQNDRERGYWLQNHGEIIW